MRFLSMLSCASRWHCKLSLSIIIATTLVRCSIPRRTTSELSKTSASRLFNAFISLSLDVLSRFRLRLHSSISSRTSAARLLPLASASATQASSPAMLFSVCCMKPWTSDRSFAAFLSSAWYSPRTSLTNAALWAAMVSDAVRKCSRTSSTTVPTVCRNTETVEFASCTILATSLLRRSSCAASALPSRSSSTTASRRSKEEFVFFSSPPTFARPVSSPQSSSDNALCRISSPANFTSTSLRNWFAFKQFSSMRSLKESRCSSCSSTRRFTSMVRRSTLRCMWCKADSFCSRL
mmetsp:Transcript_91967/g.259830  ORF Transcript_91967/g.259830 Transcript_91967/m.259830 type:complete len:293 (+) Transcript_91967:707-1585(+)